MMRPSFKILFVFIILAFTSLSLMLSTQVAGSMDRVHANAQLPTLTPLPPLPTTTFPHHIAPIQQDIRFVWGGLKMQLDSQGIPVMLYTTADGLVLAHCDTQDCYAPTFTTLPGTNATEQYSFVLDRLDRPIISFFDLSAGMRLLICNNSVCDAPLIRTVDNTNIQSLNEIILDKQGNPMVVYEYFKPSVEQGVRLARCSNLTCDSVTRWDIPDPAIYDDIDQIALFLDSSGIPMIVYHDVFYDFIHLARCYNAITCYGPTVQTILPAQQLLGASLGADGMPLIVYAATSQEYYMVDLLINVAHCNNATTCNAPTIAPVDAVPYTPDFPAMTLTEGGHIYMAYVEGERDDLRLAYCETAACVNPQIVLVDSTDLSGPQVVVAVDADKNVFVAYTRQVARWVNPHPNVMLYTSWAFNQAGDAPPPHLYTTHQPVLTWARTSWATGYAVQISDQADFSNSLLLDDTIPAGQFSYISPWLENGTYYWRVQAKRSDGTWGTWSGGESFVVSAP